ncbi:unnamed protein product, partial [Cladocopium goreaui]
NGWAYSSGALCRATFPPASAEYLDETLEPNRKSQILDVLWRSGRQGVDEEEEEVQILERPAAKARPTPKASEPVQILARPAAKARPTSKASGPVDYPTGSSSSSVVPEAKSSVTNQLGARAKPAAKAIERILRPRLYLPDTVVWFDRGNKAEDIGSGPDPVGVNFKEVSNYSAYRLRGLGTTHSRKTPLRFCNVLKGRLGRRGVIETLCQS